MQSHIGVIARRAGAVPKAQSFGPELSDLSKQRGKLR
jgi:hypothetical protein